MGFLDPKALRDWIKSRAVNNLMATAKGFFLDARVGPVIQEKIDEVKEEVNEINGNLGYLFAPLKQITGFYTPNSPGISEAMWSYTATKDTVVVLCASIRNNNANDIFSLCINARGYQLLQCQDTVDAGGGWKCLNSSVTIGLRAGENINVALLSVYRGQLGYTITTNV